MTLLRQRMIEDMQVRNLAPHTQATYVLHISLFARHFRKSPQLLGPPEIRAYLLHLVQERHVSWSYYNQTVAALRFLYNVTLGRGDLPPRTAVATMPLRFPLLRKFAYEQRKRRFPGAMRY